MTNYDQRLSKLEVSEVDQVFWHKSDADTDRSLCNIVARDRREKAHPTDTEDPYPYLRRRVPSILPEGYTGKHQGNPPVVRRGNVLKAIFYKNEKPLILGPVESKYEPPVCRPDPYTIRSKKCQYRPLAGCQDEDKDFVADFPEPRRPNCETWLHGPCRGDKSDDEKEPCIGRDWWTVSDFCQEGDKCPSCEKCTDIDYVKRCKNSWHKKYSRNTMSCQSPNGRDEWKIYNGTYRRAEAETGQSVVYSEGKGHLTSGNASTDDDLRGHYTFQGEKVSGDAGIGSWEISTNTEDVPIGQASEGTRVAALRDDDNQELWAFEAINFKKTTFVRFMKDGQIVINSCNGASYIVVDGPTNKISIYGTREIYMQASEKITADTPLFVHTGKVTAPDCAHDICACSCCGGN